MSTVIAMEGHLLGKKVAGEEGDILDKVAGFFGALADHAVTKALELAIAAANIAKQILPTLGRIPFASELTGRSLAFARAVGGVTTRAGPQHIAVNVPKFGLGGGSSQRVVTERREEEESH